MIESLTHEILAACLNDRFRVVDDPAAPFDLELTEVSELKAAQGQETFSLLFHGPGERFIAQAIHRLHHGRLGELELFLVPVGKVGASFQYEAVFNRLL